MSFVLCRSVLDVCLVSRPSGVPAFAFFGMFVETFGGEGNPFSFVFGERFLLREPNSYPVALLHMIVLPSCHHSSQ